MPKAKMTAALTAVVGGALAVCLYAGGAAPASAAITAARLTACPTSPLPPGGTPPGGGGIAYAKTVAPANNSTSILIKPDGPQIQCGQAQLTTYGNVVYSTPTTAGKQVKLVMDIQVPKTAGRKPLVVFLPGGGFVSADPSSNLDQRTYVAEQGYVVASIQYRTIPNGATYKDGLADVKSAIRYLRAHAARYDVNVSKVAVWGQSAGGYLAAMTGVTNHLRQFDVGSNLNQSSAVQAVIDEFGLSDLTKVAADFDPAAQAAWNLPTSLTAEYVLGPGNTKTLAQEPAAAAAADPITYVNSSDPPFVLLQGTDDHIVSPSQTVLMLDALRAKGVPSTRYAVIGANHGGLEDILGDTPADIKADQMWSTQKVTGHIVSFLRQRVGCR